MFKQKLHTNQNKHGRLPNIHGSFCRVLLFSFVLIFCFLLSSCSADCKTLDFFAMDTYVQATAYGKNADKFLLAINEETVRLEGIFSAHKRDSELFALNSGKNAYSEELLSLVSEAISLSELTEGGFDPTLLPVSNLWNFGGEARIPSEEEISNALKRCGYEKITLTQDCIDLGKSELDLGGIAKGYAADRFIALAKENGTESAIGSFGGMVAVIGEKPNGAPWKIAIRDPNGDGFAAVLKVSDVCISTSGAYERYFTFEGKVYHHILDPQTGYPAESDLLSVTVIDKSGTKADALSTALFVMGKDKALDFCLENGICAVLISEENKFITVGLNADSVTEIAAKYTLKNISFGS